MAKCYFCKKEIPKGEGYQWYHISGTGKQYRRTCCSLEEKEQVERDKELYKQVQYLTDEILGYPCINNIRNKKIQELQEAGYTNEQIYRCFKKYKEEIEYWISTNGIDKEYNKIAYMFGVIKNSIHDFVEEDNRINDYSQYVKQPENTEIIFEETEDETLNRLKNKKKNGNAITDFLNGLK
jgi:ribosomal protein L24E